MSGSPASADTPDPALSIGVECYADGDADVVAWSCWRAAKDRGLLAVLAVWTVLSGLFAVLATYFVATGPPSGLTGVAVLAVAWELPTIGLVALLRCATRESVRVADDHLEWHCEGILRRTHKHVPRDTVAGLTLERYEDETVWTLNLWRRNVGLLRARMLLAYTLAVGAKADVFRLLRTACERRGWALECWSDLEAGGDEVDG
jgi:hypothetical protein